MKSDGGLIMLYETGAVNTGNKSCLESDNYLVKS